MAAAIILMQVDPKRGNKLAGRLAFRAHSRPGLEGVFPLGM